AHAHERTEGHVGLAEVVLAAERDRLLVDGADLAFGPAHAVVELVGGAPELHAPVVVDVVRDAQGRGRVAVDVDAGGGIVVRLQQRGAADDRHALAAVAGVAAGNVLGEGGGAGGKGKCGGKGQVVRNGSHVGESSLVMGVAARPGGRARPSC